MQIITIYISLCSLFIRADDFKEYAVSDLPVIVAVLFILIVICIFGLYGTIQCCRQVCKKITNSYAKNKHLDTTSETHSLLPLLSENTQDKPANNYVFDNVTIENNDFEVESKHIVSENDIITTTLPIQGSSFTPRHVKSLQCTCNSTNNVLVKSSDQPKEELLDECSSTHSSNFENEVLLTNRNEQIREMSNPENEIPIPPPLPLSFTNKKCRPSDYMNIFTPSLYDLQDASSRLTSTDVHGDCATYGKLFRHITTHIYYV